MPTLRGRGDKALYEKRKEKAQLINELINTEMRLSAALSSQPRDEFHYKLSQQGSDYLLRLEKNKSMTEPSSTRNSDWLKMSRNLAHYKRMKHANKSYIFR
jgi:hypothetical protein